MTSSSAPTSSGRNVWSAWLNNGIWLMALRAAIAARLVEKFLMHISNEKVGDDTSYNTVFMAHFVRPNPPMANFTNTENDRQNVALLHFAYRAAGMFGLRFGEANGSKRHFVYQAGMRRRLSESFQHLASLRPNLRHASLPLEQARLQACFRRRLRIPAAR